MMVRPACPKVACSVPESVARLRARRAEVASPSWTSGGGAGFDRDTSAAAGDVGGGWPVVSLVAVGALFDDVAVEKVVSLDERDHEVAEDHSWVGVEEDLVSGATEAADGEDWYLERGRAAYVVDA